MASSSSSSSSSSSLVPLLLADARFPAGAGAHSGGLEEAVNDGRVHDVASLAVFLDGRLRTTGRTDAALAAVATLLVVTGCSGSERSSNAAGASGRSGPSGAAPPWSPSGPRAVQAPGAAAERHPAEAGWLALVAEADARTPSPVLREVSRRLGRLLVRTARSVWPAELDVPDGLPHPLALGAVVGALGHGPDVAALLAAHASITTPASAAIRLLGLDPAAVLGAVARLDPTVTEVVTASVAAAAGPLADLPGPSATLVEIAASTHRNREVRLFAS